MAHSGFQTPPGFKAFDPRGEVRVYRRNLPHWRQEDATYFVTFRLADSLPTEAIREIAARKAGTADQETNGAATSFDDEFALLEENWLNRGLGSCVLESRKNAEILETCLRHHDGERYEVGAFVIMPNHAHVIVRPFAGAELDRIIKSWKGVSSRRIRENVPDSDSPLWQDESHDSIIRDSSYLHRVVRYVGNNPRSASLTSGFVRWVKPEWEQLGYRFDEE